MQCSAKKCSVTLDPGWSYNPGAAPPIDEMLDTIPGSQDKGWKELGLPERLPDTRHKYTLLPPAPNPAEQSRQFFGETASDKFIPYGVTRSDGLEDTIYNEVVTPEGLDNVLLSHMFVKHVIGNKRQRREQFASLVLPTLQGPGEVWLQWDKEKRAFFHTYLARFAMVDGMEAMIVVARELPKVGAVAWTTYPLLSASALSSRRHGFLRYRKEADDGEE